MEDGQEAPLKPSMSYTILLVKIGLQINSTNRFIDQNKKFKSSLNCQASCRVFYSFSYSKDTGNPTSMFTNGTDFSTHTLICTKFYPFSYSKDTGNPTSMFTNGADFLPNTLIFSSLYICIRMCRSTIIFQTLNSDRSNSLSMKYQGLYHQVAMIQGQENLRLYLSCAADFIKYNHSLIFTFCPPPTPHFPALHYTTVWFVVYRLYLDRIVSTNQIYDHLQFILHLDIMEYPAGSYSKNLNGQYKT